MEFRPCIDIHNGQVKQIVGGSLREESRETVVNFVSEQDAAFYAGLYKGMGLPGGHVILLNPIGSAFYEKTKEQALAALRTFPGGLQAGGGITPGNAKEFLQAGASHVIVTSYVFREGRIHYDRLDELVRTVGREHLVLDVSCRRIGEEYRIVTDRWQKVTRETVTDQLLDRLAEYCSEFLVHAVDVEGKAEGIEQELVKELGKWGTLPVTYAGGVRDFRDLCLLKELGNNRLNVTIGSSLDLFGGEMSFKEMIAYMKENGC